MVNIIKKVLFFSKMFFFLICFVIIFYLFLLMHEYYNFSTLNIIKGFIPLLFVLFCFIWSHFLNCKNIYYELVCNIIFIVIFVILLRTFFDVNMVYLLRGYANYYFFETHLRIIKMFCYLILFTNGLLILQRNIKKIK